LLLSLA
jgi:Ser-tRNA(Ala) deacylase AlaX